MTVTTDSLESSVSKAAEAALKGLLLSYGLEDLTDWAVGLLTNGATSDQIELELENQPAFQARFPVIAQRRAEGMTPVSVAEVLAYERQMSELESFYGLPNGTLDAQEFMGEDRSYNEMQSVIAAEVQFRQSDPETQRLAQQFYGLGATQGEVIGYFINEDIGAPALQQRLQAASVAGQASAQGFGDLTVEEAESLVARDIDEGTARETFSLLARSEQLTRNFTREQLISLAAGETPEVQKLERNRDRALATFSGGGSFAGGVAGLGSAS